MMDRIARELGLDLAEVRRHNFISPDAFPYRTVTGQIYDSGNYPALLAQVLELGEYTMWRARQREQRARRGTNLLGLGVATFVEMSGATPDTDAFQPVNAPKDAAIVRLRSDGTLHVQCGVADTGQDHQTLLAQIAAGVFGMREKMVEVEINSTDLPYSAGTFGSRTTQISGSAVLLAAEAVREKALQAAANLLNVPFASAHLLEIHSGVIRVTGSPECSIDLGTLAREVDTRPELVPTPTEQQTVGPLPRGLAACRTFAPDTPSWSSGAHLAVVEIDRETGDVVILRYVAVDDCGRVIDHAMAEGQLHGSLAQGIGQALFEEVIYDGDGQLQSGSLMDYALPLAKDLPTFTSAFSPSPSPTNPLGAKGIGEAGAIGAPPAIVNAVLDALGPLEIDNLDMPLTRERVWQAVTNSR
jgi:carbon-monoxide dehydrogenase large subunit